MENEQEESLTQNYSLEADLVTGWKPKLKIIGPMPLNFDNRSVDRSIMALLHQDSAFYTISYLGRSSLRQVPVQSALSNFTTFSRGTTDTSITISCIMTSRIWSHSLGNFIPSSSQKSKDPITGWILQSVRNKLYLIVALRGAIWTALSAWGLRSTILYWGWIRIPQGMCCGTTFGWKMLSNPARQ